MDEPRDLGQHILRDPDVIARIVADANLRAGETVLDAGAGKGALTRPLAEAVGPRGRVVAVELDPRMILRLQQKELPAQVDIVEGDLMEVALPERLDAVVANPPFAIAAPLIERIVAARVPRSVLVLPRELIERIAAAPGSERYGKLSVRVQLRARAEPLGWLPLRVFEPPPNVPCGVVRLTARRDARAVDMATLDAVLDAAWEAWERKAKHALAPLAPKLRADSAALMRLLKENDWAEPVVNTLPAEAFARIAEHLAPRAT